VASSSVHVVGLFAGPEGFANFTQLTGRDGTGKISADVPPSVLLGPAPAEEARGFDTADWFVREQLATVPEGK